MCEGELSEEIVLQNIFDVEEGVVSVLSLPADPQRSSDGSVANEPALSSEGQEPVYPGESIGSQLVFFNYLLF